METRVYKLILGVFITLFAFNTYAQDYEYIPLVKPGIQIWTTTVATEGYRHYNRFALTEEDTLIEGDTYKKLYQFQDSVFNPLTAEFIGGLRENSLKQVFYKEKVSYNYEGWVTSLICDFSLSVGDTFALNFSDYYVKVIAIDTVEINNILRKEISIGIDLGGYEYFKFIEGIGNNLGLLFDNIMRFITGGGHGKLLCYEHNGELQYMADDITDCSNPYSSLYGISIEDNSITLYPNPTNNEISISSESLINSIEIYNSLGQKVYTETINSKEKTIDVSSLPSGVYVLGAKTDDGIMRKKIIKN